MWMSDLLRLLLLSCLQFCRTAWWSYRRYIRLRWKVGIAICAFVKEEFSRPQSWLPTSVSLSCQVVPLVPFIVVCTSTVTIVGFSSFLKVFFWSAYMSIDIKRVQSGLSLYIQWLAVCVALNRDTDWDKWGIARFWSSCLWLNLLALLMDNSLIAIGSIMTMLTSHAAP